MSIKTKLIGAVSWIAVGLGLAAFAVWKIAMHKKTLDDANLVLGDKNLYKDKVLKDLDVQGQAIEEQAQDIRTKLEQYKKEEVIYAFKKAFGVATAADDPTDGLDS